MRAKPKWMAVIAAALLGAVIVVFLTGRTNYGGLANLDAPGQGIICLGDSITRGHGATAGNDYPAQLSRLLGRPVRNAGVDGDTSADGLARLERDLLQARPRIAVIFLGGNDALQQRPKGQTVRDVERIVERCLDARILPVLVHGKYGLLSDPYEAEFQALAKKHRVLLVKNVLRGILGNPSRMSDSIHPNDAGYALIAERLAAPLKQLIAAADAR